MVGSTAQPVGLHENERAVEPGVPPGLLEDRGEQPDRPGFRLHNYVSLRAGVAA